MIESRKYRLRRYAHAYADAGIMVAPCHWVRSDGSCSCDDPKCKSVGKHPLSSHGVNDASTNSKQIDSWWSRWPNANIAIVPGPIPGTDDEWFVIDVDFGERIRDGKRVFLDGPADLADLERRFGPLGEQIVQRSGSGAEHILLKMRRGTRLAAYLTKSIDIIHGGGKYIIAAPSNHVSGDEYEWKNPPRDGEDFVFRIGAALRRIDLAPDWITRFDPHDHAPAKPYTNGHSVGGEDLVRLSKEKGTDLSQEEFEAALAAVPNDDEPYDTYVNILFAVHHEASARGDLEWGARIAEDWARKSDKFNTDDFDHRWDSIHDSDGRAKKTGKFILMLARDHGWESPSSNAVDQAVQELNKLHGIVMQKGKAMVVTFQYEEDGVRIIDLSKPNDISPWYSNKTIELPAPTTKDKNATASVSKFKVWMASPKRQEWDRIVFDPRGAPPRFLNLWQGFAVKPAKLANPYAACDIFLDHIRDVVANHNYDHGQWITGYYAHMVQRPWQKPGTAMVFRGRMGTGKTVVSQHVGRFFPAHCVTISKQEQVIGRFNMRLVQAILVMMEEALWAGDKSAEGPLRNLITSPTETIEPKGREAFEIKSFARIVISTNHKWAVPAGLDERRFAVFDVNDERIQDLSYFAEMARQLDNGGYEALLQYLLEFDLGKIELGQIPLTEALLEQKIASAEPHLKWMLERLTEGTGWSDDGVQGEIPTGDLYHSYELYCRDHRARILDVASFGKEMRELGFHKARKGGRGSRVYVYEFNDLNRSRRKLEDKLGQEINWID